MSAVGAGWCHVVVFFLERGADPNIVDQQRTTALMQASCLGHRSIVNALLEYSADIDITDSVNKCFVG
jgi:ankyrin repeat protein